MPSPDPKQESAPLAHCPKCFKTTVVDRSESGWKLCTTCSHTWQPPRESAPSGEHREQVEYVDGMRLAWCIYDGQDWPCPASLAEEEARRGEPS